MQKLISLFRIVFCRKTRFRRGTAVVLILAVLCAYSPAASAAPATEGIAAAEGSPQVVDVVCCDYETDCLVALLSDGTVRTAGLEEYLGEELNAWVDSWTDIVQICTMGCEIFGLKEDGTVVSTVGRGEKEWNPHPEPQFDPNTWTGVKELVSSGDFQYYALTNDGRILVSNDDPIAGYGGGGPYLEWSDIQKVCFFAYGEDRGLFGLRHDGTVVAAEPSAFWSHVSYAADHAIPANVVDIDSSGYVFCTLQEDGTVWATGMVGNELREPLARMRDVVQIAVCYQNVVCRLRDGTVVDCYGDSYSDWKDIVDIQKCGRWAAGLGKDGHIYFPAGYDDQLQQETATWDDIVRMKIVQSRTGSYDTYIFAWRSDGTMLAAGIDLSGLDLSPRPQAEPADITWALNGDTLTVSGRGPMPDYSTTTPPWESQKAAIRHVVIESGITHVGDQCFQYCYNLTSVALPDTVTSIGKAAFYKCRSLQEITLPPFLDTLGDQAFDRCLGLKSVVIPDLVGRLGNSVFNGCESLRSVALPYCVTEIGSSAFYGCSKLQDVYFGGNSQEWADIHIASDNKPLINADIHTSDCPGEAVVFGAYEQDNDLTNGKEPIEWYVLAREGSRMLVVSKYGLDSRQFNSERAEVSWETCTLRDWLNGPFMEEAFSAEEQAMIPSVTLSADNNPQFDTSPGKNTMDQVFLFSIPEVKLYFNSSEARKCVPTAYAFAQGAGTMNDYRGLSCWWWLRSPGDDTDNASCIFAGTLETSAGDIHCYGFRVNDFGAIRPAMWIESVPSKIPEVF